MDKSPDAFRTISEVAEWLGVQAHVLRFWESKFTQVKPVKRAGGRRYYRPADMLLLGGIKQLLHDDGMTIKGVQKILREKGVAHVADMSRPLDGPAIVVNESPAKSETPPLKVVSPNPDPAPSRPAGESRDFTRAPERPTPAPAPGQIDLFSVDKAAEEDDATPAAMDGAPAEPVDETAQHAPATAAADDAPTDAATAEDELADQTDAPMSEPSPDMPAFHHRAPAETEDAASAAPEVTPSEPAQPDPIETQPSGPRARSVDAPDPPLETDMEPAPGCLSELAELRALSHRDLNAIVPVLTELADWHNKVASASAGR